MTNQHSRLKDFKVIGINHWDAAVPIREKFSLSIAQKDRIVEKAREKGIDNLILLSTCNRTELFGVCENLETLSDLLLDVSEGSAAELNQYGFVQEGEKAVLHLYRVAVGLDAQILGDLQIIKQVKEAYDYSVDKEMVDGDLHKLLQSVLRTHKRVRHETDLGDGAASIAYAAVQFIKHHLRHMSLNGILLVGMGKIGKVTCKNLVDLGASKLTVINRNRGKAAELASKYQLEVSGFDNLKEEVAKADLIIVATGADQPVLLREHFVDLDKKPKVLLDLSVPRNIESSVAELPGIILANMDQLGDATDMAYRKRRQSIPEAENIIREEYLEYLNWLEEQKVVPTIVALTHKLDAIRQEEIEKYINRFPEESRPVLELVTKRIVNKIAAHSIDHLKANQNQSEDLAKIVRSMFDLEAGDGVA